MSRHPTLVEMAALRVAVEQARLLTKNKEAARAQLLQIQLLLARQAIPVKK